MLVRFIIKAYLKHRDSKVSASGGGAGGIPSHYAKNWLVPPSTVLPKKCWFCNFQAVVGHFAQIDLPQVGPISETLDRYIKALISLLFRWGKFRVRYHDAFC